MSTMTEEIEAPADRTSIVEMKTREATHLAALMKEYFQKMLDNTDRLLSAVDKSKSGWFSSEPENSNSLYVLCVSLNLTYQSVVADIIREAMVYADDAEMSRALRAELKIRINETVEQLAYSRREFEGFLKKNKAKIAPIMEAAGDFRSLEPNPRGQRAKSSP
jgi:hypothetical protein